MNEATPPEAKTPYATRGIFIFLGLLLFEPHIRAALSIEIFRWTGGKIELWNVFVIFTLLILLPALIRDKNTKIEIPFLNKIFKND